MKFHVALHDILMQKKLRQIDLCEMIGRPKSSLSSNSHSKNVTLKSMREMLKPLSYKVIVVPQQRQLQEGEYEVQEE